ncbi:MAG: glutamate racemase [Oscillospiraceae bacterium]
MQQPNKHFKIGVTDSGIGGLTVVKELQKQLPNESIVYFGDNRNCPYGNKQPDILVELAANMITSISVSGLKLTAIACNTTSALIDSFAPRFSFPLFSIVSPTAELIANHNMQTVGILATMFTIKSGCYKNNIHKLNSTVNVIDEGSPKLAALIDSGNINSPEIETELTEHMDCLLANNKINSVVLGCTHYPIVIDLFHKLYPEITFIDPAVQQVNHIKAYLTQNNLLSDNPNPTFEIYTTGSKDLYINMCNKLGIKQPNHIYLL